MKFDPKYINDQIVGLWRNSGQEYSPLLYPNLEMDSILFIGMNPSFSEKGFVHILKGTKFSSWESRQVEEYYKWENFDRKKVNVLIEIEELSRDKHPYFKKFKDISAEARHPWTHIDLLLIRNTSQKSIEKCFTNIDSFIQGQLEIFFLLLNSLSPKIIVIENAFVSRYLKNEMDLIWDDDIGTYRFKHGIPVFLSGMLTGGRALDLGTYDRLKWHINKVLKHDLI